MISVVVLFCDKDKEYISSLLKNIKDKMHVPYEVVLIDNRTDNSEKLVFKNCKMFSFGYNATQVQGRKKGVELAEGEYIWFVDADDEILEVSSSYKKLLSKNYDIIVFNDWASKERVDAKLQTDNVYDYWTLQDIGVMLWNKWIRREVLCKTEEHVPEGLLGSASEDTMLVIGSLKYGKSVYYTNKIIYRYHRERSGCGRPVISTVTDYKRIIFGHDKVIECILKMLGSDGIEKMQWELQELTDCKFFIEKLFNCIEDIVGDCIKVLSEYFTVDVIAKSWENYSLELNQRIISRRLYEMRKDCFKKQFPDNADDFNAKNRIKYYTVNDEGKEYCYREDAFDVPVFEEVEHWQHTLSIVGIVYEGNIKYLERFIKQTKSVEVSHEVVIVDNRKDKTVPLECDYKVVQTEGNVGILDGRRAGFEASTMEYVWFVDIDDEILKVPDTDYGDADIFRFPFYDSGYELEFNESRVINDKDVCTESTNDLLNCMLWNKWFKREVLENVYKKLPHFFCVYSEDVLVSACALEFAKKVQCVACYPIYNYTINETSATQKTITKKEEVDILFEGFETVKKLLPTLKLQVPFDKDETIEYYLKIVERADDKIKPYFINTLYEKFGKEKVCTKMSPKS